MGYSARRMDSAPREICPRCRRPLPLCYCAYLPALETQTRVVILQHPRESRVPIGTARMAHLSLLNSELHTGIEFKEHPRVSELRALPGTAILFPGAGAIDPSELAPGQLKHLIVVDGTWAQARKVLKLNPELQALPRVGLRPEKPGNYRIRAEPSPECLATIEAISSVLGVLERAPEKFAAMLTAFTYMVDQQLLRMAQNREHRKRRVREAPQNDEARLLSSLNDAVFVHAEVNAHARSAAMPGEPELLHLFAARPSGEEFEAILAPRRPLAPNAPTHLGLAAEKILAGEDLDAVRARWREFSRPGDLHVTWGRFSREQLAAEKLEVRPSIDLRRVVARRLQARPGAPELAIRRLGGISLELETKARANQVCGALAQLVKTLQTHPRKIA